MVDDDNRADGNLDPEAEDSGVSGQQAPRRSTWSPPLSPSDAAGAHITDDDLAQALEADFERTSNTSSIPVINFDTPFATAFVDPPVEPEPTTLHDLDDPPNSADIDEAHDENVWPIESPEIPAETSASAPLEPEPEPEPDPEPQPLSEPEMLVEAPHVSNFDPPVRRSAPTSELAATLSALAEDGGDPAELMAQLEDQLRLRQKDASDFEEWQRSMVADGGAEALAQVETIRQGFGDIIDSAPSSAQPVSAPNVDASFPTHTFRTDEVLDSALLNFPAPMTAPVANIPPPAPGLTLSPFVMPASVPAPPVNPTPVTSATDAVSFPEPESTPAGVAADAPEIPFASEAPVAPQLPPVAEEPATPAFPLEPEPDAVVEPAMAFEFDRELDTDEDGDSEPGFWPATSAEPPIPDLVEPVAPTVTPDPFDFDSLINGDLPRVEEQHTVFSMAEATPTPTVTGSMTDELVQDGDQIFADAMGPMPVASERVMGVPDAPGPLIVPFNPVASSQVPVVSSPESKPTLTTPPAFRVEESSGAPTPTDQRVGRASRLFWLWFAANSSIVSVAFGGAVLSLGMSLRQAIVATLIGVSVSFLPLGLGTLAGKWSGQPTMIVSRATFGHLGNILPAALAIIVRVFWGAVLLWFLAAGTARILFGAQLAGPLSETQLTIIGLAVGFLLALVIAFFGYGLIARIQMVFTIISALLIVGLIVVTWPAVNIPMALTLGDGPWILVLTGAVLVFSFVGLVWAVSSADLARYQRASGSGASSMLWSTFGATIPAFVLIAYGAVLAASSPDVAAGLIKNPLDTIALLMPVWYPIPLIAALAFSLLSGVVISIYSGGFALQATGASMRRSAAVVVVGAGVAALAVLIAVSVGDFTILLRDVATSLAVPIAAWAGIFGAEMMIRSKGFVSQSLVKRGGIYPDVNWVNLSMLIVASVIGFGLTTATVGWLGWQGYLFGLVGIPLTSDLAGSDLGVFVALVIGLLVPIVAGIPGIRRQEAKARTEALTGV